MKKFLTILMVVLLTFSVVRVANGKDTLTLPTLIRDVTAISFDEELFRGMVEKCNDILERLKPLSDKEVLDMYANAETVSQYVSAFADHIWNALKTLCYNGLGWLLKITIPILTFAFVVLDFLAQMVITFFSLLGYELPFSVA